MDHDNDLKVSYNPGRMHVDQLWCEADVRFLGNRHIPNLEIINTVL